MCYVCWCLLLPLQDILASSPGGILYLTDTAKVGNHSPV